MSKVLPKHHVQIDLYEAGIELTVRKRNHKNDLTIVIFLCLTIFIVTSIFVYLQFHFRVLCYDVM